MRLSIVQTVVFGIVALAISSQPAAAQQLGAGISFLGDEGGTGFILDYSKSFQKQRSQDFNLGWVGDFSFFRNSEGNAVAKASVNTLLIQGGVRATGEAADKLTWLGQGLIGFRHSSGDVTIAGSSLCSNADCSDNGGVLTIGGGLQYALREKLGLRGQLDFPIALGDGGATTRFSVMLVFQP